MSLETKAVPGETPRYRIDAGSNSAHCCFEFTVVDTTRQIFISDGPEAGQPYMSNGKTYCETVCECFEEADAKLVCNALNGTLP